MAGETGMGPAMSLRRALVLLRRNSSAGRLTRLGRLARQRVVPARRGLGGPAGHDVLQLLLVDGLVLDERLGHRVQLLEVALENALGTGVVGLDDAAHLLVDRVRGNVRDLLVLGDAASE